VVSWFRGFAVSRFRGFAVSPIGNGTQHDGPGCA